MHISSGHSKRCYSTTFRFLAELSATFALALVLFALIFRTAMPMGAILSSDETGVRFVTCLQMSALDKQLGVLDGSSDEEQPPSSGLCALCMAANEDQVPLPVTNSVDLAFSFVPSLENPFAIVVSPRRARLVYSARLGRDPPQA